MPSRALKGLGIDISTQRIGFSTPPWGAQADYIFECLTVMLIPLSCCIRRRGENFLLAGI